MKLLEVKNLTISFDGFHAVEDVTVWIDRAEIVGLVGESGSGKTVISLSLMDLLGENAEVSFSSRVFDGKEYDDLSLIRGKDISMVFQEPMSALNPLMTVGSQIEEVLLTHGQQQETHQRTIEAMRSVELPEPEELYRKYPHELSGGMLQRVLIAMATILNPKLIIADEPTTALDVSTQAQILRLLKRINKENQTSILFISHDLRIVKHFCDRLAVLYLGHVLESGPTEAVMAKPLHPYTFGLIRSIPDPAQKDRQLYAIPGRVPALSERPDGCPFAPRCFKARERCRTELPDLADTGTRRYRCFYPVTEEERALYAAASE